MVRLMEAIKTGREAAASGGGEKDGLRSATSSDIDNTGFKLGSPEEREAHNHFDENDECGNPDD